MSVGAIAGTAYLELRQLGKHLGDRRVLDGVSLDLPKGELLGLLGPSGSGKTTLLNIVGGFLVPDSGSVRIGGGDIVGLPPYQRDIGFMFQGYALFPHMDVFHNIGYGLRQRRAAKAEIRQRVGAMIEMLGLGGLENRLPRQLSGGQQQRVALARALVVNPRLMLLDEPLANLDANLKQRIRFEIREVLRRSDVTSIFVTHDQDEAFALCDRVAVLHEGRVQQVGTALDLIRSPVNAFVAGFIGDPNIIPATVTAVDADRVRIEANGFDAYATAPEPLAVGRAVNVFVRPEAIALDHSAGDAARHAFTVRDAVYLAKGQEILIDGPIKLRARAVLGDNPLVPGTTVQARWRADHAHAFPAARA